MKIYGPLWACIMCPGSCPWVGDFDAGAEIGECPRCSYSVGIYPVAGLRHDSREARMAKVAMLLGTVDRLDRYGFAP
jgi:hypothetical protein